jgi:two-component system cell cycle response regulator CpdR
MSKRILIVEDEDGLRAIWQQIFRRLGHKTGTASDGAEGLAALEAGEFDVLLTDLRMPGMSGLELLAAVEAQDRFSTLEIFVCSGFVENHRDQILARRGVRRVIDKPFRVSEMVKYFRDLWAPEA